MAREIGRAPEKSGPREIGIHHAGAELEPAKGDSGLKRFRAGEHDPEGVTERRWLTPAALKEQGVEASALRRKLEEYEAAVAAAREAALGAGRTVT